MEPPDSAHSSTGGTTAGAMAMPSRDALERAFCEHLPRIEALAASVARRSGFPADDCPDVVAWVRLRLIEHDYAILARHRGESSLVSYLAVVIAGLVRDYRMATWGRWRPSAAAVRLGTIAVRLETLTGRDGLPIDQAVNVLLSEGAATTERELRHLHRLLPVRPPLRPREVAMDDPTIEEALATPATTGGDAGSSDAGERETFFAALERAVRSLPPEEQLVVRLRFGEGLTIADVARALGLDEKALYRRLPQIVRRVRQRLEAAGYSSADAAEVLADA